MKYLVKTVFRLRIHVVYIWLFASSLVIVKAQSDNGMPIWSPDGQSIAYNSNQDDSHDLWLMQKDGSDAINLTSALAPALEFLPSWSQGGETLAFNSILDDESNIWFLHLEDMSLENLTADISSSAGGLTAWSEHDDYIAYMVVSDMNTSVWVTQLENKTSMLIADNAGYPKWSVDNTLYFTLYTQQGGRLQRMDITTGDIATIPIDDGMEFAISSDGTQIAYSVKPDYPSLINDIVIYSLSEDKEILRISDPNLVFVDGLRWSPDGKKIAFSVVCDFDQSIQSIWLLDTVERTLSELINCDFGSSTSPDWSPDNEMIAFQSEIDDKIQIWAIDINTQELTKLTGND